MYRDLLDFLKPPQIFTVLRFLERFALKRDSVKIGESRGQGLCFRNAGDGLIQIVDAAFADARAAVETGSSAVPAVPSAA